MSNMFCPYCNTPLDPGGQFCHACGAPLEAPPALQAPSALQAPPVPDAPFGLEEPALAEASSFQPAQSPSFPSATRQKKPSVLVWIAAAAAMICLLGVLCVVVIASLIVPVIRDQVGQSVPMEKPVLVASTPTLRRPDPVETTTQVSDSGVSDPEVTVTEVLTPTPLPSPTLRPQGRPFVGELAPEFTLLDANIGESVTLSHFTGQPVLILFWATWCGYCEEEMPFFQAAHEAYQTDGLVILGVDYQDQRADVVEYGRTHQLTFPLLLDKAGEITDDTYLVNGFPTSVFIFRDGTISFIQIGTLTNKELNQQLELIIAP
jgi:thiol-disulfide isomerase/thioredoxin